MADPLIVPGVCRFAINGVFEGQPIANILDVHIDGTIGSNRTANILDQAHIIVSAWADQVLDYVTASYTAESVSWLDMDSANGSTGSTSDGTGTDFPRAGQHPNSPMPANVAWAIDKEISSLRGLRKGRMYVCGVPEGQQVGGSPNEILAATVAGFQTNMDQFLSDVNQSVSFNGNYDSEIVVVHTKNTGTEADPVIEYVGMSHVNTLRVKAKLRTQRRRMG